jgi:hypothetical protein
MTPERAECVERGGEGRGGGGDNVNKKVMKAEEKRRAKGVPRTVSRALSINLAVVSIHQRYAGNTLTEPEMHHARARTP